MTPLTADPVLLLVAGLVIDALFGDMPAIFRYVPHPVVLAGRAIAFFDRKLNREARSEASRRERGIVTVVVLVCGAALLGLIIERACRGSLIGAVVEAVLIAVLVAQRSLYDHVAAVAAALATGGLAGGREAVRHIVGRDPMSLDSHGVARAAIESLAENFSDGVVAPVFWYLLLGLPGLLAYKMANTLDSMIGHRTPHYRAFGWAAARLDDRSQHRAGTAERRTPCRGGGVRQKRPAGPRGGHHAARRAQAPFAQCGLARECDGWGARFGIGRTAPVPGGSRRRSVARRRQRPGRGTPTSRGDCSCIGSPASSKLGCWWALGWRRMLRCSPEAGRPSRGQQRRKVEAVLEMIGERVEGSLDIVLVRDFAGLGTQPRQILPAERVARKQPVQIAAGDQPIGADAAIRATRQAQHPAFQGRSGGLSNVDFVAPNRHPGR